MDEANQSVASYFLPMYTSSLCWTCGNPFHSLGNFSEKREYKRKPIVHYQSHLGYEPYSNTFDSYPYYASQREYNSMWCRKYEQMEYNNSNYFYQPQEPSHQQSYHYQGQNIDIDIGDYREEWNTNVLPFEEPLHIPVSYQVVEDVVDSSTTYHPTNSQEPIFSPIMDTKSQDSEDFFIFLKEDEECLDSLEELLSYVENDVEVTHIDLNPPQSPHVVINQVGEDNIFFKNEKEQEKISLVEEEHHVVKRCHDTSLSTLTHIIVTQVHRKARVVVRELRHSLCN
ncbi:hypothetical protein Tco_1254973 [Tanacetum coccineum]